MRKQACRIALIAFALLVGGGTANSQVRTDISGTYNVTGSSETDPRYEGELQIIKHGEIYQFRWDVGDKYEGVGLINGNTTGLGLA
jgi:major membrane immunogen (membrane-anchored lipoprotein)